MVVFDVFMFMSLIYVLKGVFLKFGFVIPFFATYSVEGRWL